MLVVVVAAVAACKFDQALVSGKSCEVLLLIGVAKLCCLLLW
jgi:hypothetical protein